MRMEPLRRLDLGSEAIDLVDFGDFRGWMLTHDNLYRDFVCAEAKGASITTHYAQFENGAHPRPSFTGEPLSRGMDCREFLYSVIRNYIDRGIEFDVLDVGAFMGDQSLRYGNFFRALGHTDVRVLAIDPSLSGDLIPYNVALNKLEPWIEFLPVAIGPVDGPMPFALSRGHSDSGRIATSENVLQQVSALETNAIVPCIRLDELLSERQIVNAIIKLDLEGLDAIILRQIAPYMKRSLSALIFELTVHDKDALDFAEELMADYAVFDVGYFPNMFRLVRHESKDSLWWQGLRTSPYGYTDVLALPKSMPGFEDLMMIAESARPGEASYQMTWPNPQRSGTRAG